MIDTWYGRHEYGHVRDVSRIRGVILTPIRFVLDDERTCILQGDPKCLDHTRRCTWASNPGASSCTTRTANCPQHYMYFG